MMICPKPLVVDGFVAAFITDPALEEPASLGLWAVATMNQTRTLRSGVTPF